MTRAISFQIEKKLVGPDGTAQLGRVGTITTPHGTIQTPAFIVVGTKATVKTLNPEQVKVLGAQAVLANTYHLYLEPGERIVKAGGGLHRFMNWSGPTFTDSGGFQAFSLGVAFGKTISKLSSGTSDGDIVTTRSADTAPLAKITEDGVAFKSYRDGSEHFFSPEKSIEIQNDIGADIIFAFDECTSPTADKQYQREALERTHRWAKRSLARHIQLQSEKATASKDFYPTALFGIVQGGRFENLRKESAEIISGMNVDGVGFDGFGIGGSFDKEDIGKAVACVNTILPEGKPRHLLGIGEPEDFFLAIENGCDTFDCVTPTRIARNGTVYTTHGKIHIENARYREDFGPIEKGCECYACKNYSIAYIAYLSRTKEILAYTLTSIHNLHFIVHLVANIRQAMLDGKFYDFKNDFLTRWNSKKDLV